MKMTAVAVDRPIASVMFYLSVVVVSVVSFTLLPIDLLPDVTMPSLTTVVEYPGAGPEEIETLLARPIEETMGSVNGVEEIETSCQEDRLSVRLSFVWGSDLDVAADDVRQRLDRIRGSLPDGTEPPFIYKYDFNSSPIIRLGLSSTLGPMELRQLAEKDLRARLERVPGVAAVEVEGGLRREIQVDLNQERLDALNLTPSEIVDRLRAENLDAPVGEVAEGQLNLLVRTEGQFAAVPELENVVVAVRGGVSIRLGEVAKIVDGHEEIRSVERVDGKPGVTLAVIRQSNSNVVEVADLVDEEVARIKQEMPHLQVSTLWDSSRFIRDAIDGVKSAALFGSLLAVLVLLFFLHNVTATLVIAITIPVSVLACFALLYFCGFTLNIVSFGGIALGVGMMVDNSIVVLENIYRHRNNGDTARNAAVNGTSEVAMALTASTLTSIVVFLPLLFLTGPAQILFGQMAYVVAFSQVVSLIIALTLLPMLCGKILGMPDRAARTGFIARISTVSEGAFNAVDLAYKRTIELSLRHRPATLFLCVSTLLIVIPLFRIIKFEYMPTSDENEVRVYVDVAPGTPLEEMDIRFREIERIVLETIPDEMLTMQTSFGLGDSMRSGANEGSVRVRLKDHSERTRTSEELADLLGERVREIPGISARARASGGLFIFRMLQGQGESLSVQVLGHDLEEGQRLAVLVQETLEKLPGISDARIDDVLPRPAVSLQIDRTKAAEVGLSVSEIAEAMQIKFGGQVATVFREGGEEFDVRVRLRESDRFSLEDLTDLWLVTPTGTKVAAANFVTQKRTMGPSEIDRIDQERYYSVDANLEAGASLGNVMRDVQKAMATLEIPKNMRIAYGGEYEDQQDSFYQLMLGFILSMLLVYMVMAAQFESLLQPFLIMLAVPFALIGVVLTLVFTNTTLNVQSIIGTTMLGGVAVNNAIILVDYMNLLRREHGMPLFEAIAEGGRRRLRPILMTTFTSALGLVPMAIGIGSGSELQAPMARVLCGGFFTSTLITLFYVPVTYSLLEQAIERLRGKRSAPSHSNSLDKQVPVAK